MRVLRLFVGDLSLISDLFRAHVLVFVRARQRLSGHCRLLARLEEKAIYNHRHKFDSCMYTFQGKSRPAALAHDQLIIESICGEARASRVGGGTAPANINLCGICASVCMSACCGRMLRICSEN